MIADGSVAEASEAMVGSRQCKATNERGEPCSSPPVEGSAYCYWHDPSLGKERAEARKKGGRNRRQVKADADTDRGPVQIASPQDVLALIEQTISDCLGLENSLARARTIGYLAGVALRAQEVGELEQRLEILERGNSDAPSTTRQN